MLAGHLPLVLSFERAAMTLVEAPRADDWLVKKLLVGFSDERERALRPLQDRREHTVDGYAAVLEQAARV